MSESSGNFIRQIIDDDLQSGKHREVVTRFPPEPNGYLHIGHAKSICLNFGIARDYADSHCNLRFDDTNPHKENQEYVQAIQEDVRWLGFDWGGKTFYASDYFEKLYGFAVELIEKGLAYVDELNAEQTREFRGTPTEPGRPSPHRDRPLEENLDLFRRMRAGEFPDGALTLRARIDMASPNLNMRDPVLYRIRHGVVHHQTGDQWVLYPMYDFTHPISDALEGVTHSLCTLEFEDHRPLYDWVLENISVPCRPRQIEFSRLNLQYTVTSKRKLTELVEQGVVNGWDDPRLPTISGMRRRGYPAAAIRDFCDRIGVTKAENSIEMGLLEACVREELDRVAPRRMAVLNPLRVVIENFDDEQTLIAANHPKDESMGTRELLLSREIFIDHADYLSEANKKFKRLVHGGAVRLRNGYVIQHLETERDEAGRPSLLRVRYYPDSLEGNPEGIKVRGVIHWVSADHGVPAEVRLYNPLFRAAVPGSESGDYHDDIASDSLSTVSNAMVEPGYLSSGPVFQFEREGYFVLDPDSSDECPVFNRTTGLRDSWGKGRS